MIYLFLSRALIVVDNVFYAIVIKSVELFSLITLWVLSAAILSTLVLLLFKRKRKLELGWIKKHPYQLLWYFISSILWIVFWWLAVLNWWIWTAVIISRIESLVLIIIWALFFNESLHFRHKVAAWLMIWWAMLFAYKWSIDLHMWVMFWLASTFFLSAQKIYNKTLAKHVDSQIVVSARTVIMTIAISSFVYFSDIKFQMPSDYLILWMIFIWWSSWVYIAKYFNFKALETVPLSIFTLWSIVPPVIVFAISMLWLWESYEPHRIIAGWIILSWAYLLLKKDKNA